MPTTIQVDVGATLDVSEMAPGLSVTTGVQGGGTILGTLTAGPSGGMSIRPGDLATDNTVHAGAVATFDAAAGTLTLGGLDMSTAITGISGNPEMVWDLAQLSELAGFDRLVTDSLTLGGASTLRLNFTLLDESLRPDYAANGGSLQCDCTYNNFFGNTGPTSIADAESAAGQAKWDAIAAYANGVFYPASTVTIAEVADGASSTYLLGEKYLDADAYDTGTDLGDNEYMYSGDNEDIVRWGGPSFPPAQDTPGYALRHCFGSAHPSSFNVVFCDGSVHSIDYNVDRTLHGRLADRQDNQAVDRSGM